MLFFFFIDVEPLMSKNVKQHPLSTHPDPPSLAQILLTLQALTEFPLANPR